MFNKLKFIFLLVLSTSSYAQVDIDYDTAGVANPNWRDPVADVADLPTLNNNTGDVRLDYGAGDLYYYDGGNWQLLSSGGGGGAVTSVNAQTGVVILDTDDIAQGSTNLYATQEVTDDFVNNLLVAGSGITLTYNDAGNTLTIAATAGSAITALTGDVTASGPGSVAATLANTAVTAGSYTYTSLTVDAKGRLTAASSNASVGGDLSGTLPNPEVHKIHTHNMQAGNPADGDFWVYETANTRWSHVQPTTTMISEGSNLYLTDERVDDRVSNLLVAGSGIDLTYNDAGNSLTVAVDGSITSGILYQGVWNANTNSPSLPTPASCTTSELYVVGTAGSTTLDGNSTWLVGDFLFCSASNTWERVVGTNLTQITRGVTPVTSFSGEEILFVDAGGTVVDGRSTFTYNRTSDVFSVLESTGNNPILFVDYQNLDYKFGDAQFGNLGPSIDMSSTRINFKGDVLGNGTQGTVMVMNHGTGVTSYGDLDSLITNAEVHFDYNSGSENFQVRLAGSRWFGVDMATFDVGMGDLDSMGNGANVRVLDSTNQFLIRTTEVELGGHRYIFPSGAPTANEVLSVASVGAGPVYTLDWVAGGGGGGGMTTLPNTQIYVGNASNVATAVAMSGDATISNTGVITAVSASDTVAGKVELATVAETNTGTDATRAVTPDSLAGSNIGTKNIALQVVEAGTALVFGNGVAYFRVPAELNGMNLVSVACANTTASSGSTSTYQFSRGRQASPTSAHSYVSMLSTVVTIDDLEYDSKDSAVPAVINSSNDDVQTGDLIRVDIVTDGSGTEGLFVNLGFRLP